MCLIHTCVPWHTPMCVSPHSNGNEAWHIPTHSHGAFLCTAHGVVSVIVSGKCGKCDGGDHTYHLQYLDLQTIRFNCIRDFNCTPDYALQLYQGTPFFFHENLFEIVGTPVKTCLKVTGTLVTICWNYGSRDNFQSDLLRLWFLWCICTWNRFTHVPRMQTCRLPHVEVCMSMWNLWCISMVHVYVIPHRLPHST